MRASFPFPLGAKPRNTHSDLFPAANIATPLGASRKGPAGVVVSGTIA